MKKLFFILFILAVTHKLTGQQLYSDFEGVKVITFGVSTGVIDSMFLNPAPSIIDSSAHCAKYVRDTVLYDNIKLYPDTTLQNVNVYATSSPVAPKITMKLYSSAPPGTLVQLQLGSKSDDNYPSGIHSEYQAFTTVQNAWQNLTFDYYQSPSGSLVLSTQVNKVVILFNPSFTGRDTIYFDDLKGPELLSNTSGIPDLAAFPAIKLYQNSPNPAKETTHINFQLGSSGVVSLELFDILGNPVSSILNQTMKMGTYSIPVDTEDIPNGIYFYVLKKGETSKSMKMIVSK